MLTPAGMTLPATAYILLVLLSRGRGQGWRLSVIHAATAWGLFAVLITEALSIPRWLTAHGLALAWLALDLALVGHVIRRSTSSPPPEGNSPGRPRLARRCERWTRLLRPPWAAIPASLLEVSALTIVALLVALVGLVALISPPNTWDAMQYHMPRIVHWIQNRSVAFYPTNELKQLHMAPGAEFLALQWHLLSGGDRFANLVQWFAYVGCIIGVTLIARSLGAGARGQTLAALLCATIPQGILYASAAKNDWVLAFWLVAFAIYFLRLRQNPTWSNTLGASATLALACFTKSTAYVFLGPMVLVWITMLPWNTVRSLLARTPVAVAILFAVNAAHFTRNHDLYGSPLGPSAETPSGHYKYTNDRFGPATLVSNVVRNVALHLGVTKGRSPLEPWIVEGLERVGIDANDPATTWTDTRFAIPGRQRHEALAGNPVHVALIALALLALLVGRSFRTHRETVMYSLGLLLAFLAFCALLRWQPWHTRLHLPLFVLWAPPIAVLAEHALPRALVAGLVALLAFQASSVAVKNQLRPLTGRTSILKQDRISLYFAERPDLRDSYVAAAAAARARGCRRFGLDLTRQDTAYEYPFLVLVGGGQDADVRLVNITNPTTKYATAADHVPPCAVVCVDCPPAAQPQSPRHHRWSSSSEDSPPRSWAAAPRPPDQARSGSRSALPVDQSARAPFAESSSSIWGAASQLSLPLSCRSRGSLLARPRCSGFPAHRKTTHRDHALFGGRVVTTGLTAGDLGAGDAALGHCPIPRPPSVNT